MNIIEDTEKLQQEADNAITVANTDEALLEPVEIDIGGKAEEGGEAKQGTETKPKVKQPGRFQQRIDKLSKEVNETKTVAERLAEENRQLKEREQELLGRTKDTDRAAMVHYEGRIEAELKIAKTTLAAAIDSGDSTKQADAQAEVARLAAEKQQIDNWKASHPDTGEATREPPKKTEEPKREAQPQTPQVSEEFGAWMKQNEWFVPNTPQFDVDMHQEAVLYGRKLERIYQREGREDDIGTQEYWDEITNHMREEFPDNFEEEAAPVVKQKTPFKQQKSMSGTLPATKGASLTTGGSGGGNRVSLSGDERRMAHTLASSGALLGDKGQRLTPAEAEVAYARQKANITKKGA